MEEHEATYRKLKESSYMGWGGKNYENRMQGWDQALDRIFSKIGTVQSILEIGCGAGDVSLKLAKKGYEVTGIDFSKTAIEWAKEKSTYLKVNTKFIKASATDQKLLLNQQYDLIIDGNCLHCLFGEDRVMFYKNVDRLLKKNGYLFVSTAIKHVNEKAPTISRLPRCILTKESLLKEFREHHLKVKSEWISDENHLHFYGLLYRSRNQGEEDV